MRYVTGMKVAFEDEVFTVVKNCTNCDKGLEVLQKEEDLDTLQICTECDGLVNGSDTYYYQEDLGYKVLEKKEVA
tara:strand:- start:199 stop:423 length:225 start_codon:yes stop_codon:yes gene_type:complete